MPEREVQTGIGAVTVKRPRVRDRDPQATGGRIRFTSSILPPYLRRAKSVEALLPWLYLKGISSGDFSEALAALMGPDAPGLTASTIGRLKAVWWDEYKPGKSATFRLGATSIFGPTGSASRLAWTMTNSVFW